MHDAQHHMEMIPTGIYRFTICWTLIIAFLCLKTIVFVYTIASLAHWCSLLVFFLLPGTGGFSTTKLILYLHACLPCLVLFDAAEDVACFQGGDNVIVSIIPCFLASYFLAAWDSRISPMPLLLVFYLFLPLIKDVTVTIVILPC